MGLSASGQNGNPIKDAMNRYYEPHHLGSSSQQPHIDWPEPLDRQIDGIPGVGALRLANGLESAVRWSIGRISRWRQRHAAIREFQALSDHYLRDIGLNCSQVVSTVEAVIKAGDRPV